MSKKNTLNYDPTVNFQFIPSKSNNVLIGMHSESKGITLQGKKSLPNFIISQTLHKRLLQYVNMKKDKSGLLYGTSVNRFSFQLESLSIVNDYKEEGVSQKLFYDEQACAVIVINSRQLMRDRLLYEVEKCQQGLFVSGQQFKSKGISVLEQVYLNTMRMFLTVTQQSQQMKVKQFSLFPNLSFNVKPLKITPYKFDNSSLLSSLINKQKKQTEVEQSFKQQFHRGTYGFLICKDTKFNVIKRSDPIKSKDEVIGLWIYMKGIVKQSQYELNVNSHRFIWGLASSYIINNKIPKTSVLVNSQYERELFSKSFMLCVFSQTSTKPKMYEVQVVGNEHKWMFMQNQQHILMPNVPLNVNMGTQCDISSIDYQQQKIEIQRVNLQKQEEDQQFIPNFNKYNSDNIATERNHSQNNYNKKDSRSSKVFSNDTFAKSQADAQSLRESQFNDKNSDKSYDEKDIQIRQLKKQLQFYKQRYQNLEKLLLTQSIYQQGFPNIYGQQFNMNQPNQIPMNSTNPMNYQHPMPGVSPQFLYLNYQLPHHQLNQVPNGYYQMPQPQFHQYSSQISYGTNNMPDNNKIFHSTVLQNNKQSPTLPDNFSFVKKQSNSEVFNLPLKQSMQLQTKQEPKHQEQQPKSPKNIDYKTIQQRDQINQKTIQIVSKPNNILPQGINSNFNEMNDEQQFLQFSDKQLDLNFSHIPHQKSPKPDYTDHDAPSLLQYSLAYSCSRDDSAPKHYKPHLYQYSVEYEQTQIIKKIQKEFK